MNNLIYLIGQIITAGVFFIIGMLVIAIRLKSGTVDAEDNTEIDTETEIENCKQGCKCDKCRERSINTMLRQDGDTGYGVCGRCIHKNKCEYWLNTNENGQCEAIKILIELYESYDEIENTPKEVH